MTILLISAETSDKAVALKTVATRARSDRDTEADQTPAFADVFVSLVAPKHHSSATPLTRITAVHGKDGAAHNHAVRQITATSTARQDRHDTDRNHNTQVRRDTPMSAPLQALTAIKQRPGGDTITRNNQYLNSALLTTDDADANITLPNRFSQIIAALPRTLNDAGNKGASRDVDTERMRITPSYSKLDKHNPEYINAHQARQNIWQPKNQITSLATTPSLRGKTAQSLNDNTARSVGGKTAQSLSDNAQGPAIVIKSVDRVASADAVAFGKPLSHDKAPDHDDLPAVQTMKSTSEILTSPGLSLMVSSNSISNIVPGANILLNTANIDRPLHSAQWGSEFGRQFVSLIRPGENGNQRAELRLDPPELGPLRVTININDSVVQAMFISSHSAVRNALEQALPQLQQQLEQEGLSLGQTSVDQDDGPSHFDFDHAVRNTQTGVRPEVNGSDETNVVSTRPRTANGLIDTFV